MAVTVLISLVPLDRDPHVELLQEVYRAAPSYWQMFDLPSSPFAQAARDLQAATETPGRTLMGIVRPLDAADPNAGAEMVGVVDFRLHWPREETVYLGLLLVAERCQRQGIGSGAWALLRPWLIAGAKMKRARLAVEGFNPGALKFFEAIGFRLTGEANRVKVGEHFVRLLYMEQALDA